VFLERPGRLLSKEFLSERVWGRDFFDSSRAIDTAVQRLRHKLGAKGRHLETVKGYGYRFQEEN
jgi:DNA-binding response OmpR family regulator